MLPSLQNHWRIFTSVASIGSETHDPRRKRHRDPGRYSILLKKRIELFRNGSFRRQPRITLSFCERDILKKRGRSVNLVDRYRQDMVDYARWDEVKTVREKQIEIREEVDFLRANPKKAPPHWLEDREKMLKWVGDR